FGFSFPYLCVTYVLYLNTIVKSGKKFSRQRHVYISGMKKKRQTQQNREIIFRWQGIAFPHRMLPVQSVFRFQHNDR
ncbi:MAG: hypothetical protein Q4B32_06190, partial [Clostridia bacterium]|nr:hypothetical protein [Clostridia bacterium]